MPFVLSVLCVGLAALSGCKDEGQHAAAPPPPQVGVVAAHSRTVALDRQLTGRLSAYYSANVVARVSGVLLKRAYKEGGPVAQGQTLFEIDPAYYQTVLDNALATLAADQATYVNNRVTAERDHRLLPVGSVSQQTVDDADAALRTAAAKVKADQAAVQAARINLGYTRVTSPIGGIAGQQQVTQGALVGTGTSDGGAGGTLLTTVEQIDQVYANFTISAADLLTLRQARNVTLADPGQDKVDIVLPNGKTYDQPGVVDFSDTAVNAATGAVNLRALVPNPHHDLLPGMYVALTVHLGQQNGVYPIPQQAVQRDPAGAYVLVVGQDGKVARKTVSAEDSLGTDWLVTGGLADGDRVIVSGLQSVREGVPATPVPWQPPTAPASTAPAGAGSHP